MSNEPHRGIYKSVWLYVYRLKEQGVTLRCEDGELKPKPTRERSLKRSANIFVSTAQ